MMNTKKLIKIARKSQEMATIRRKSITGPGALRDDNTNSTTKVEKGHFVVYTLDGHRFVFPLGHLKTYIFRELLTMSEEEFGLPSSGPITFPCDASFMKDVANLFQQRATLAKERALLQSLITKSCHPSFYVSQETTRQQLVAHAC
ncbi:putative small auxin-up RNA [Helianthus debilis subsp. tardiflorus]